MHLVAARPSYGALPDTKKRVDLLLEGIGTFVLVVMVIVTSLLLHGVLSPVLLYALLTPSILIILHGLVHTGGHFNPGVTLGMLLSRVIDINQAVCYVAAQCCGGAIGAAMGLVVQGLYDEAPIPSVCLEFDHHIPRIFVCEVILSGAVIMVALHVACSARLNAVYALLVAGCVLAAVYSVTLIGCGTASNPIITADLIFIKYGSDYTTPLMAYIVYLSAPLVAAVIVASLFRALSDVSNDSSTETGKSIFGHRGTDLSESEPLPPTTI